MPASTPPSRLIPPLAWCKLAAGWAAYWAAYDMGSAVYAYKHFPYWMFLVASLAFALTGAILLAGGRHDPRARALGSFFVVAATTWSGTPIGFALDLYPNVFPLALLRAVRPDAFLPFFLLVFARDFPSPPLLVQIRRRYQIAIRASWIAGAALFLINFAAYPLRALPIPAWLHRGLDALEPKTGMGLYYQVVFLFTGVAFLVLLIHLLRARGVERRRGRLLLAVIVLSLAPILIEVIVELLNPRYVQAVLATPAAFRRTVLWKLLPALTFPITIPYVILKHRVLDLRSIARRAIQHTLARWSVGALTVVPLAALALYVIRHGDQRVKDLITGPNVPFLVGLTALGALGFRYRKPLLETIDRRFFREQYDARRILTLLVERIRSVHEVRNLAALVTQEIDLALHLEGISMLVLQPKLGVLVDLKVPSRRFDASSNLAHAVQNAIDALDVDLHEPRSPLHHLDEAERRWLGASGFRLIVPILARDGALLGLVGLGEKKSGLPFLREDRQLLHAIANSAAWVLELDLLHTHAWRRAGEGSPELDEAQQAHLEPARECTTCSLLHPPHTVFCTHCSKRLVSSHVPYVLPGGRYRFEKRIGLGAMGIVYRATDLSLGRPVAIKTLRYLSPEAAVRLRYEARTAAAVIDPHLAAVYGVETWQGTPMLALELLEGTLGQRIQTMPLSPIATVDLGIAMAGALHRLHQAEILHRDVKPTNIGFNGDGQPKLMDFGIARAVFDLEDLSELTDPSTEDDDPLGISARSAWEESGDPMTISRRRFAGTLGYLSPEALDGDPPDSSFDLWALSVVLYECLLGRKVFGSGDTKQVVARIKQGRAPDFTQVFPLADPRLAALFRSLLHKLPARRPASAAELRAKLVELKGYLEPLPWAHEPLLEAERT